MGREVAMVVVLAAAAFGAQVDAVEVTAGQLNHGRVVGTVDGDATAIMRVIRDCEGTARWFPDLLEARLVAEHSDGYRCAGVTDLPWPLADRTWTIDVRVSGDVARFALVPGTGNVVVMEGRYALTERSDGRTEVDYEAWVDIGVWVPEFVVAWATRRVLPGILAGLETRLNAS
jgi:hypothetical protein